MDGRTRKSVAEAVERLSGESPGGEFLAAPGDVTTDEGAARVRDVVPAVDVLVNHLGVFGAQPALDIGDDEWRRSFEVNVLAAVRMIRAHLPGMRERSWGRVQNIASDSAIAIPAEMIHYGMSKTALLAVSQGFAKEAAGTGGEIRVDGGYVDSILP